MLNKGDIVHTSQIGQFREDELFVIAMAAQELLESQAYSTDIYGNPMIIVAKQQYYPTIKDKTPHELIDMWHRNRRDVCPIYVYPEFEFKLFPQNNVENARISLEVLD